MSSCEAALCVEGWSRGGQGGRDGPHADVSSIDHSRLVPLSITKQRDSTRGLEALRLLEILPKL